ncbi:MAG: fumarylacetoacetate hydrolase family protein [Planctomycetes bacterium]|nr:fumarylacetoacetate hydrolase family protein [Planctomycetota bacterium]
MSPFGSALPEIGLVRSVAGEALLVLEGGFHALGPLVRSCRPELAEGPPELLVDRLCRAGAAVLEALVVRARGQGPTRSDVGALAAPLAAPGKVVALGRTFAAHARELGNEPAKEPLVFGKLAENLRGSGASIVLPVSGAGERYDNEVELAVVLGADLRRAEPDEAARAIAGYTIANDFTWRSEQDRAKKAGQPWFLAKNLPGAMPCGPAIVPAFLLPEPRERRLVCRVDGEVVQDTDYRGLQAEPAELLAWLSRRLPLSAGDLVLLGTPAGVSTVTAGSRVEAWVEGLGCLSWALVEGEDEG